MLSSLLSNSFAPLPRKDAGDQFWEMTLNNCIFETYFANFTENVTVLIWNQGSKVYDAEFITCFLDNAIFIKFYLKSHEPPERLSHTTVWEPLA